MNIKHTTQLLAIAVALSMIITSIAPVYAMANQSVKVSVAKSVSVKKQKKTVKKHKKKTVKKYLSTIDKLKLRLSNMQKTLKTLKRDIKKLKKKTKKLQARKAQLITVQSDPIQLLTAYFQGEDPAVELQAIDTELSSISEKLKKTDTKVKSVSKSIKSAKKTMAMFSPKKRHLTRSGGVFRFNGHRETWYSQRELPGGGLRIPGRHIRYDGVICDKDGYVCVASPNRYDRSVRRVIDTSMGLGKAYDFCPGGSYDIYTAW